MQRVISPPTENQHISKSTVYSCCTIKHSIRDEVSWQIQHSSLPRAVLATPPHPSNTPKDAKIFQLTCSSYFNHTLHYNPHKLPYTCLRKILIGGSWWIWRIMSHLPKFSLPIFTDTWKRIWHMHWLLLVPQNFPCQLLLPTWFAKISPCQTFPQMSHVQYTIII